MLATIEAPTVPPSMLSPFPTLGSRRSKRTQGWLRLIKERPKEGGGMGGVQALSYVAMEPKAFRRGSLCSICGARRYGANIILRCIYIYVYIYILV